MVKLDVSLLRYLTKDDFRVLTSVEMGMKNHELVPGALVSSISSLRDGGVGKLLHNLCRQRLAAYERGKRFDGYRLTYMGYDYIALNALRLKGVVTRVGNQIGVGKESDVFVAANDEEERFALKIHRLGRTCFRAVNEKRDYHSRGRKLTNWIYASRLAAVREAAFMGILHGDGFPVPKLVDSNRHCVVMELIEGTLLNHIQPEQLKNTESLCDQLLRMILTLANDFGLVHGDFNEFNIMIRDETQEPVLIDFPQMVPVTHKYAKEYFERDVNCIISFFKKRFEIDVSDIPTFHKDVEINQEKHAAIAQNFPTESFEAFLEDVSLSHDNPENLESQDEPQSLLEYNIGDINAAVHTDKFDEDDVNNSHSGKETSIAGSSIASKSTITPEQVRQRLRKEHSKVVKRQQLKHGTKNVKGEASAVVRHRKEASFTIRDGLELHALGDL